MSRTIGLQHDMTANEFRKLRAADPRSGKVAFLRGQKIGATHLNRARCRASRSP
jgi:hypothetical protein